MKEWQLYVLLFAQMQLSVSLGLSWSFDDQKYMGMAIGALVYIGLFFYLFLLYCSSSNFG